MKLQHFVLIASCAALLSACSNKFAGTSNPSYPNQTNCQNNHYLERYGCSLERLTAAARNGDADAQYGLGYMYYYGIGTVRDETTARKWIKRSAAQGQPLALKAYAMMTGHALVAPMAKPAHVFTSPSDVPRVSHPKRSLHQSDEDVSNLNAKKPNRSVQEHLPAYGRHKKAPVLDSVKNPVNSSQNAPVSNANAAQTAQANSSPAVNAAPAQVAAAQVHPADAAQVAAAPQGNSAQGQNNSVAKMAQMVQQTSGAKVDPNRMTPNPNPVAAKAPANQASTNQTANAKAAVNSAPKTAEASPGIYANKKLASADNYDAPVQANQNSPEKSAKREEGIGHAAIPNRLSSAERWMMKNPSRHYSLQIMGGRDLKAIQHFIAQHHLQGRARYYSAELQGQKWYMLVYGNFATEKQALHASKKLPKDLRSRHPWIKSYAEIQKEIKDREIIS